ncbi:hypothetical protein BBK14_33775 [Parafrankia soli]|uniref:Uncharacterized protein n=1 Tax=Parafrankia soli TaxID=2599596 RepID=A0A1S1QDJ4_9ACTN|nr:hypothetical protein [Parafrankia soli]OHV32868.1 hypothetical protein BBK14_33775 [Parafrankia soli]
MNGGIYLPAPAHRAGGPDGQGWNRLSVWGSPGDQCALKPMSWASLRASRNTARFAGYGYCGPCTRRGECDGCPTLSAYQEKPRRTLMFGHPTALVRILERPGRPRELHLMDRPDQGWGSTSLPWTWAELARLPGWNIGRHFRDEHSEGFWMIATTSRNGLYGDPTWESYEHDGSTLLGVPA